MSCIEDFVKGFSSALHNFVRKPLLLLDYNFKKRLYFIKREIFKTAFELALSLFGLLILLIGLILFLNKYFSLEFILIITGILILYIVLLFAKFK